MCLLPGKVFTHLMVGIAIAVGLLVGLVHHIDTVAVTEFVEQFAVGVVRGAQEIDIRLLHQADVFFVGDIIDVTSRARMVVMAIDTSQLHVPTINLEHLADTLHTLHAQMIVKMFCHVAPSIKQFDAERIEVRLFG